MELRQLEYFRVVAREHNLTRASEQLFVAQPSLSRQIRKLEDELGAPLFDRTSRGMHLTAIGEVFLDYVERGFAQFEAGRTAVRELLGPEHGQVRMALLPAIGSALIPEPLALFWSSHPQVQFTLRQGTTGEALRLLLNEEVDLVVVTASWQLDEVHEITRAPLLSDELYAVLPSNHPLASRAKLSLSELAGATFVMPRAGSGLRAVLIEALHAAGIEPTITVEGDDFATVRGLVAAGMGISLLPRLALHESGRLRPAVVKLDPAPRWSVEIAWHAERYLPVTARTFRDFLRQYFAEHPSTYADASALPPEPSSAAS
jgi:LysR family transcriptional regulator, transcription activator of glutamate synthase operon